MGDSACWLDRICLDCGLFITESDDGECPGCGSDRAALPGPN